MNMLPNTFENKKELLLNNDLLQLHLGIVSIIYFVADDD